MMPYDFLEVYDYENSELNCEQICSYFDEVYNFIFIRPIKKAGLFFWRRGDIKIIDRYGPDGLSKLVKIISDKTLNFQSGYLYHYAFLMLIGLSILLTYFILY